MASFSNRQSPSQPISGRATVAHLGQAPQPQPPLLSGRAAAGHLGVGRRYTGSGDLLTPRQLPLPAPPLPDFARLRADAERLQRQLAAHDRQVAAAYRPLVLLSPAEQARRRAEAAAQQRAAARARAQFEQRLLAEYNDLAQSGYLPAFLRQAPPKPKPTPLSAGGRDCFMPLTFWKSQNPTGDPKVGWAQCCNTVKKMVGYNSDLKDRIQIVRERGKTLVGQPTATAGLAMLDQYLALHKPVMAGVHHSYASGYNKAAPDYETTDHFVAIVGTGTDAKGKYYRFFDVGTKDVNKRLGVAKSNRLYYDARTGSYSGKSAVNGKTYTISQLRFKPGTF